MFFGYVYVMIHPAHPQHVVVASASTDPEDPTLAATVAPFLVIFSRKVFGYTVVLKEIQRVLGHYGHSVEGNPNYFTCTPTRAITVVWATCDVADQQVAAANDEPGPSSGTQSDDPLSEADELYDAGCAAAMGSDDTLEDHHEALRLFARAAKLGCVRAYDDMGNLYNTSDTVRNERRAVETWNEGTRNGSIGCWAQLAKYYDREGHAQNSEKSWDRFFSLLGQVSSSDEWICCLNHLTDALSTYAPSFFKPVYVKSLIGHQALLRQYITDMLASFEQGDSQFAIDKFTRCEACLDVLTANQRL